MNKLTVGMVLFDRFELLDVFGPLEMLGLLRDRCEILMLAEQAGTVTSAQGPKVLAEVSLADAPALDILLVPGGIGRIAAVENVPFIKSVKALAEATPQVATICTGAAILARTGLLDGHRATTNKLAFNWVTEQAPQVEWVPEARWVEDGKYMTAAGVSAGMDMALALIAKHCGQGTALAIAREAEYDWHRDPDWDPFARMAGLVT